MLYYDNKGCVLRHLLQLRGSVFPKAMRFAIPSLLASVGFVVLLDTMKIDMQLEGGGQIWTGYNLALSFLLVFRTQQAYARWWEGGTLLQQIRGEWYNATSSLFAFTSSDEAKREQVLQFQQLIVRLMSMMYCSALQEVSLVKDEKFEILDTTGLDMKGLRYLRHSTDRCAVLLQWIQRSVVTGMGSGVVPAPPPVVSRVFQELGRGMVNLHNVKKIKEFPFPFPYAQMITFMLMVHWVITPMGNILLVENKVWGVALSFISVLFFWSINYIAIEIEIPFGDEVNHLPIKEMQTEMNRSLRVLLDKRSQTPPPFDLSKVGKKAPASMRGVTQIRHTNQRQAPVSVMSQYDEEEEDLEEEEEEEEDGEEEEEEEEEEESDSANSIGRTARKDDRVSKFMSTLSGVSSQKTSTLAIRASRRSVAERASARKSLGLAVQKASTDSDCKVPHQTFTGGSISSAGRKSALQKNKERLGPEPQVMFDESHNESLDQAEVAAGPQQAAASPGQGQRPPGAATPPQGILESSQRLPVSDQLANGDFESVRL